MIEINLLPRELVRKEKIRISVPAEAIMGYIIVVVAVLLVLHLFLFIISLGYSFRVRHLSNAWAQMQPQVEHIDGIKSDAAQIEAYEALFSILDRQGLNSAQKLNIISDSIVARVWLSGLTLSKHDLVIKGSSVSTQGREMAQISEFLHALKADKKMIEDVGYPELVSVQKRKVKATDVVDFIIKSKSTQIQK